MRGELLREANDVELSLRRDDAVRDAARLGDLEGRSAHLVGHAHVLAARITGGRDDADIAGEIDGHVGARLRVHGLRAHDLAPLGAARDLLRRRERLAARGLVTQHHRREPAALRILVFCTVHVEPRADLGLGHVGGDRRVLARLGEHRVAEDGADLLLGRGILVVALCGRLLREELHRDHLVEQLLAALLRLVPEPVELIHVLEGGGVVAERDGLVPYPREHLPGLFGRQRLGLGVPGIAGLGLPAVARLAAGCGQRQQHARKTEQRTGVHGGETYHRIRRLARLPPRD